MPWDMAMSWDVQCGIKATTTSMPFHNIDVGICEMAMQLNGNNQIDLSLHRKTNCEKIERERCHEIIITL